MQHYYETFCGVYAYSHDTLEEAIDFAEKNGVEMICEIGGSWTEYSKCNFCGEWVDITELNEEGDCPRCEVAIRDHNGLWGQKR